MPYDIILLVIIASGNTLRLRQNGCHFADMFKCIFLNENVWNPRKISLKFLPKCPIDNNPALVQRMAWCLNSTKPSSEPMMLSLLTYICVTWPQWVNGLSPVSHHYLNHNCIFRNKLMRNLNRNTKYFIEGNTFENVVCNTATILF